MTGLGSAIKRKIQIITVGFRNSGRKRETVDSAEQKYQSKREGCWSGLEDGEHLL